MKKIIFLALLLVGCSNTSDTSSLSSSINTEVNSSDSVFESSDSQTSVDSSKDSQEESSQNELVIKTISIDFELNQYGESDHLIDESKDKDKKAIFLETVLNKDLDLFSDIGPVGSIGVYKNYEDNKQYLKINDQNSVEFIISENYLIHEVEVVSKKYSKTYPDYTNPGEMITNYDDADLLIDEVAYPYIQDGFQKDKLTYESPKKAFSIGAKTAGNSDKARVIVSSINLIYSQVSKTSQ